MVKRKKASDFTREAPVRILFMASLFIKKFLKFGTVLRYKWRENSLKFKLWPPLLELNFGHTRYLRVEFLSSELLFQTLNITYMCHQSSNISINHRWKRLIVHQLCWCNPRTQCAIFDKDLLLSTLLKLTEFLSVRVAIIRKSNFWSCINVQNCDFRSSEVLKIDFSHLGSLKFAKTRFLLQHLKSKIHSFIGNL